MSSLRRRDGPRIKYTADDAGPYDTITLDKGDSFQGVLTDAGVPSDDASDAVMALTKVFDSRGGVVRAVEDLHLTVRKGEVFGLLGPNGAGKTTTVRILATLLRPDAGRALVGGQLPPGMHLQTPRAGPRCRTAPRLPRRSKPKPMAPS